MMLHRIGLWLYYNAQTIQAVAAILAFLGLVVYALDTRKIRKSTLAQSDASRRPYFHPEIWKDPDNTQVFKNKNYCQFTNCGSGIALNICWRFLNEQTAPLTPLGSCAVGRVKYLFGFDGSWIEYEEIDAHAGVYLEYEDTAKMRYWTTVTIRAMADATVHLLVDTGSITKRISWG